MLFRSSFFYCFPVTIGCKATIDPTGAKSNHGDRVIADALANWRITKTVMIKQEREVELAVAPVGSFAWRIAQNKKDDTNFVF